MEGRLRLIASLLVGCVVAVAIAREGVVLARGFWPAYAAAEPHKAYDLNMLWARLAVGAASTAGAALASTIVARDAGRAAWWLGALFLAIALPNHLYWVWNDYPAWYHCVFLAYLVPVAGWTGHAVARCVARYRPGSVMA